MKAIRKFLCAAAVLCLLLALLPAPSAAADAAMDELYKDKSWEEVVEGLFQKYNVNPDNITLAYYNTVTGEEHYLNPDQYMVTGSMYKVPLNMAFAEKVANGEMTWDSMIGEFRLSALRDETIIYSNNDLARTMWTKLSDGIGYHRYREIIAPLMGEDAETVDQKYYENNFFTARQMLYCLKLLYANPDRFPTIIETMQKAEPNNYFKLKEHRFDIGHKYGYLVTDYHLYLNDCGVAFTDDPILLVMFTDNVDKVYSVMTEYCTLMCDYTQYHTAERIAAEQAQAEEEARQAEAALAAAEAEDAARKAVESSSPLNFLRPAEEEKSDGDSHVPARSGGLRLAPFLVAVVTVAATVAALAILARWRRRYGLRMSGAVAAAILSCLAIVLCTLAVNFGSILVRPRGNPQDAVREFFTDVSTRNYDEAYQYITGYSSLGLENTPSTEAGRILLVALRQSYGYSLIGESTVDGLDAHQQVELRCLDCAALEEDTAREALNVIASLSRSRDRSQVYAEDGNYLPSLVDEAYAQALGNVLSHASDYYASTGLQLNLRYVDGGWRIVPDAALLKALAGGLGY